ncbi:MAG: FAD-binding oxidoreductase [Chlamydiales bacterium]
MLFKSELDHQQAVKKIQKNISNQKSKIALKSSSPSNTLRNGSYKAQTFLADISVLNGILALDPQEKWVIVEPKVTMRTLCQCTLRYGMIPPVVPEFTSITVGGAIMGAALESSSHRFGQFNDVCLEYELILGNGELVKASPDVCPDLFYGISSSYGTLGILTKIKMRLIRAKKYVHVSYHRFSHLKDAIEILASAHNSDFVEGIVFNRSWSVVALGEMSNASSGSLYRQNHYWSSWYYPHIYQKTAKESFEENMLLDEYLFRFDRGAFWIGRYLLSYPLMTQILLGRRPIDRIQSMAQCFPTPSILFRFLFGAAMSSKGLYKIWHKVPKSIKERLFFIHDFYAPSLKANEVLELFLSKTEIFPIWLCPIRGTLTPQLLAPHYGKESFINIGMYGIPHSSHSVVALSKELEHDIVHFGGRKMLYSYTYYDPDHLSKIYHLTHYDTLRKKYFADGAFPSLYDKITNEK